MEFIDWINKQVETRGWTFNELARRAGLSSGAISLVLSEQRSAGPDFCNGVARALKVPPERVFRLAGLLPSLVIGNNNDDKQQIEEYWPYLTPDDRDTLTTIARTLYEKRTEYHTDDKKENK